MATSNFHNVNASNIFAVELENDWDYEDLVDNLKYELNNLPEFRDCNSNDFEELRSYPSSTIGKLVTSVNEGVYETEIVITPVVRSGYYEGCNLDWNIELFIDGEEVDSIGEIAEGVQNDLIERLENIYSQYSERLGVFARFSNGETIYNKVA